MFDHCIGGVFQDEGETKPLIAASGYSSSIPCKRNPSQSPPPRDCSEALDVDELATTDEELLAMKLARSRKFKKARKLQKVSTHSATGRTKAKQRMISSSPEFSPDRSVDRESSLEEDAERLGISGDETCQSDYERESSM